MGITNQERARIKELRKSLDDTHTDWEGEEEDRFRKSFREWLDEAAGDPYHPHYHDAKEYLELEAKESET